MSEAKNEGEASPQSDSNWLPDVIGAYRAAGGTARFPQIYRWIKAHRRNLPKNWEEVVRSTVYHHSSDSPAFAKGDPDVFLKKSHGLWGLRFSSETIVGKGDLLSHVVARMTPEELASYAGNGKAFLEFVKARVQEIKQKYKID